MGFLRRLFGGGTQASAPEPTEHEPRELVDLRSERGLPPGHRYLVQGLGGIQVVGESNYRTAIESSVGKRPEGHKTVVDAVLVWESTNAYDPNAIAVTIGGKRCGYLGRDDAKNYRPVIEWYRDHGITPVVRADVRGGWQFPDGTWAEFGITVYMASAEELHDRQIGGKEGR